ncbi:hypothetical protein TNCV_142041 [Trichonephila clavipes]|nr:hypothetical protein TNCV_142041 [Trichonephila clavipes]
MSGSTYFLRTRPFFSVQHDNRQILIRRERGTRNNSAFVHENVRFGGGGVIFWVDISIKGLNDLEPSFRNLNIRRGRRKRTNADICHLRSFEKVGECQSNGLRMAPEPS